MNATIITAQPGFYVVHPSIHRPNVTVGAPVVAFRLARDEDGEMCVEPIGLYGPVDPETHGLLYPDGRVSLPDAPTFPDLDSANAFHLRQHEKWQTQRSGEAGRPR